MTEPAGRKRVATHLIKTFELSERNACKLEGVNRTAFRYISKSKSDDSARERLKELTGQYTRYGYLMLHGLLKAEEVVQNKKHAYRLYTEERLQVQTKKRKTLHVQR